MKVTKRTLKHRRPSHATLTFLLDETGKWEFRQALCGARWYSAWSDLKQEVYRKKKWAEMPEELAKYVEELYGEMCKLERENKLEVGE